MILPPFNIAGLGSTYIFPNPNNLKIFLDPAVSESVSAKNSGPCCGRLMPFIFNAFFNQFPRIRPIKIRSGSLKKMRIRLKILFPTFFSYCVWLKFLYISLCLDM